MARLSFRCGDDLVRGVDEARGLVPRETWLRSIVSCVVEGGVATRDSVDEVNAVPEPAERPGTLEEVDAILRRVSGSPFESRRHAENCKCPVCS